MRPEMLLKQFQKMKIAHQHQEHKKAVTPIAVNSRQQVHVHQ
ncbi:hypothetical protein KsCSTR_11750 [Candidatus Kuenenia stuttgartiensis]|uniref:Uncharacterized protein n=1 Tax=Kuenenia stuttgartiensis TaxID=174633 RepID=A0A6G7GMH6_KUEST|nr:hypothetical protein KsCSTR_11750 [Candidatus Kuenenia stuttgartiensis]